MSANAWPDFQVTKLDAARRQLETSIRLLFEQADAVSVHTLAYAAFGILKGIAENRKETRVLAAAEALAAAGKKGDFWKGFNRAGNFFKHADKDPDGVFVGAGEEENEALLSIAVQIYRDLGCLVTPQIECFSLWWACINFSPIEDVREPFISWLEQNSERLHADSRQELLVLGHELFILLSNQSRIKGGAAGD